MRSATVLACACLLGLLGSCPSRAIQLALSSSDQQLRSRPAGTPASSPGAPPILILALDGVSRSQLYWMIRAGELPNLTDLLGGDGLAHAYFDESLLSTMPSTTMPAWVSAMTGVAPADHGVAGNEYFIREQREFACPAPVSFFDIDPTLAIYTDRYIDRLTQAQTVYEAMREKEPNILIWVTMNHLFRGADRMLLAKHAAYFHIYAELLADKVDRYVRGKHSPTVWAEIDRAAVDVLTSHLARDPLPDVLTLYVAGTDLYAHVADEGPDAARRTYMRTIVDPLIGRVVDKLRARGRLDRLWVIVLADHGHTAVVHDKVHALGTGEGGGPPTVLRAAGFRVRPFRHDVAASDPFSAVLAYGGATAYVYLADRSRCPGPNDVCPWDLPPRYAEDVLPAAEAYFRANRDGTYAPQMKGTLDMILVRRPKPFPEVDLPFEVYVGAGATVPIEDYLRDHPHPTYIDFAERMHDLAVGVRGERAGDIMLLAHDGDMARPEDRYYFARPYHSWHGSPSRQDSEIPLIVANRHHGSDEIGVHVRALLGDRPFLQKLAAVLLAIRSGALGR